MTEGGALTAGEDGRHQHALPGHLRSSHGVYASPERMESASSDSMLDRGRGEAEMQQLPSRDHAMLRPYQGPDHSLLD